MNLTWVFQREAVEERTIRILHSSHAACTSSNSFRRLNSRQINILWEMSRSEAENCEDAAARQWLRAFVRACVGCIVSRSDKIRGPKYDTLNYIYGLKVSI